ncbi:MAG: hypothetical protein AB8B91_14905 [Rubripirellula sp.]
MTSQLLRIRHRLPMFIGVVFAGTVLTIASAYFAPRQYQSRVQIRFAWFDEAEAPTWQDVRSSHDDHKLLNEITDQLVNDRNASADLTRRPSAPGRATRMLRGKAKFHIDDSNKTIDAHFLSSSPGQSRQIAEAWTRALSARHVFIPAKSEAADSLAQLLKLESNIQDAIRQAIDEAKQAKLVREDTKRSDSEEKDIVLSELKWARGEILDSEVKRSAAKARKLALEKRRSETPATVSVPLAAKPLNENQKQLRDTMLELQAKQRAMTGNFKPDHPASRLIKKQVAEAKATYEESVSTAIEMVEKENPKFAAIQQELDAVAVTLRGLDAEFLAATEIVDRLQVSLQRENNQETQVARLQAPILELEQQLQQVAKQRRAAEAIANRQAGPQSAIVVSQPASLESQAVAPNLAQVVGWGMLTSLLAATGITMLFPTNASPNLRPASKPRDSNDVGVRPSQTQPDLRPKGSQATRMPFTPH